MKRISDGGLLLVADDKDFYFFFNSDQGIAVNFIDVCCMK